MKLPAIFLGHFVPKQSFDIRAKFYGDRPSGTRPSGALNARGSKTERCHVRVSHLLVSFLLINLNRYNHRQPWAQCPLESDVRFLNYLVSFGSILCRMVQLLKASYAPLFDIVIRQPTLSLPLTVLASQPRSLCEQLSKSLVAYSDVHRCLRRHTIRRQQLRRQRMGSVVRDEPRPSRGPWMNATRLTGACYMQSDSSRLKKSLTGGARVAHRVVERVERPAISAVGASPSSRHVT